VTLYPQQAGGAARTFAVTQRDCEPAAIAPCVLRIPLPWDGGPVGSATLTFEHPSPGQASVFSTEELLVTP
jgi:hypothetical protein